MLQTPVDGDDNTSLLEIKTKKGILHLTSSTNSSAEVVSSTSIMRTKPVANNRPILTSSSNIQYYSASCDTFTFNRSEDANNQVRPSYHTAVDDLDGTVAFLPFTGHHQPAYDDGPEHYFMAPADGEIVAVMMKSNNNLAKDSPQWNFLLQVLERSGTGGSNVFTAVDAGDTRVAGTTTGQTELEGVRVGGDFQEVIFPFAMTDKFPIVAGRIYSFVARQSLMAGTTVDSKTHALAITYVIALDETTAASTFGGWLPD